MLNYNYNRLSILLFIIALILITKKVDALILDIDKNLYGEISGIIIEKTSQMPLEYANIMIYRKSDSTFAAGTISNSSGEFNIDNLALGHYYLIIQFIGYDRITIPGIIIDNKNKKINLGKITIAEKKIILDDIEIIAEKNAVEYKLDKKVVNAAKFFNAEGGSAIDILLNTSMVSTNTEGDIVLRGNSDFVVLIDGRQSPLSGNDALRGIPASMIDKIEIITNPSAKYEAEGSSGIINIITKKQKWQGISGLFNGSLSSNNSYSGDINIQLKQQKYSIYFGADGKIITNKQQFIFNRYYILDDYTFYNNQKINQTTTHPGFNIKAGIDYQLSEKNWLTLNTTINNHQFHKIKIIADEKKEQNEEISEYFSNSEKYDVNANFYRAGLTFTHLFDKVPQAHELTINLTGTNAKSNSEMYSDNFNADNQFNANGHPINKVQALHSYTRKILEMKSDYKKTINDKISLEAGSLLNYNQRDVQLQYQNYNPINQKWVEEPEYANNLMFAQNIFASYAMISGKIFTIEYQSGLRGELTDRALMQNNTNQNFFYTQWHFFPSVHLMKTINDNLRLQLNYSRRIQRPSDFRLNPFPSSISPNQISIGNPLLKPDFTDSYELNINKAYKKISISLSNYLRITNDDISEVSKINNKGMNVVTYDNFGYQQYLGSELSSDINYFKKININPSINYAYVYSKGSIENYQINQSDHHFIYALNFALLFSKQTKIQFLGQYHSKTLTIQGKMKSHYNLNLAIKRNFNKNKGSLVLQCNNLWKSNEFETLDKGINFTNTAYYSSEKNILKLSLSYKINNYKKSNKTNYGIDENY